MWNPRQTRRIRWSHSSSVRKFLCKNALFASRNIYTRFFRYNQLIAHHINTHTHTCADTAQHTLCARTKRTKLKVRYDLGRQESWMTLVGSKVAEEAPPVINPSSCLRIRRLLNQLICSLQFLTSNNFITHYKLKQTHTNFCSGAIQGNGESSETKTR